MDVVAQAGGGLLLGAVLAVEELEKLALPGREPFQSLVEVGVFQPGLQAGTAIGQLIPKALSFSWVRGIDLPLPKAAFR